MAVFLHETIDPVRAPGAHTRYLDELGKIVTTAGNAEGSAGGRSIANWVPVFLTGQWPQIIGFWQMPDGWDGFARHFDSNPELFHRPLERWYGERSGGFDRVLLGTDWSPTVDDVATRDLRAPVVLHETVTVRPGAAPDYLAELGDARAGLATVSVLGGYEVALRNSSEVIVLWSFPDIRAFARTQSHPDEFPDLQAWRRRSRAQEKTHIGVLLRPTDWSPLR